MQKDTVILLAKYNKAANEAMNGIVGTLNAGEWDKPLGGYFSSVRSLCSHLYICDFNWLKRYSKLRDFAVFNDPFFARESYSFKEEFFPDMGEYLSMRPELDDRITAFAGGISGSDLERPLKYSDSSGAQYERNFGGLILHCFNHGTHHRGMISVYLEILGKANDFNSLNAVL
ncbi:MAG: DinB family protein [Treponema sp.]|jgi:uncharacterized damage-inducible protein DinB|nr:DinB family protein [Treponema sp.]